jgi:uncharacterized protein YqeY
MLLDDLKAKITVAVKAKDEVARDVLRLALGEVQTGEARASRPLKDEEIAAIIKKLVKSNEETLALAGDGPQAPTLRKEIEVLSSLLPKTMSVAELVEALASQKDALRAAKGDGPATGIAMKHLKSAGLVFEGNDVAAAVKTIRS